MRCVRFSSGWRNLTALKSQSESAHVGKCCRRPVTTVKKQSHERRRSSAKSKTEELFNTWLESKDYSNDSTLFVKFNTSIRSNAAMEFLFTTGKNILRAKRSSERGKYGSAYLFLPLRAIEFQQQALVPLLSALRRSPKKTQDLRFLPRQARHQQQNYKIAFRPVLAF